MEPPPDIHPAAPKPSRPEGVPLSEVAPEIEKTEELRPVDVPIGSVRVKWVKEHIPYLLQQKALSVFALKSVILTEAPTQMSMHEGKMAGGGGMHGGGMHAGGGMSMGAGGQAMMATIGGLLFVVNLPVALFRTYSLTKEWSGLTAKQRLEQGAALSANYLLGGAGVGVLAAKIPELAALMEPGAAATSMKVSLVLGPVGMAILSVLSLKMGANSAMEASKLDKRHAAATELTGKEADFVLKAVLTREANRFKNLRNFEIGKSVKFILIGIGVGIGAAVMAGLIGGALATPFGWAAVAIVAGGLVVGVAIFAYRRYRAKEQEGRDVRGLVELLAQKVGKEEDQVNRYLAEQLKRLSPPNDLFTDAEAYAEEILHSSVWPGNPSLLQLVQEGQK